MIGKLYIVTYLTQKVKGHSQKAEENSKLGLTQRRPKASVTAHANNH